jgi:hypothetical protein
VPPILAEWDFWGAVIGAVGLLVMLWQSRGKGLAYRVLSSGPVFTVLDELEGALEIRYRSNPVRSLHKVEFALISTGRDPIRSSDFEEPIGIRVPDGTRLLIATPATAPGVIRNATYTFDHRSLTLQPTLLNPGESIALRLLIEGFSGKLELSTRIAGVSSVPEVLDDPRAWRTQTGWAVAMILAGVLMRLPDIAKLSLPPWGTELFRGLQAAATGALLIGLLILFLSLVRHPGLRRFTPAYRGQYRALFVEVPVELTPVPPQNLSLEIHAATYGSSEKVVNVTQTLRARVHSGKLDVVADNEMAGTDPVPNVAKELRLDYSVGGSRRTKVVPEGQRLNLP